MDPVLALQMELPERGSRRRLQALHIQLRDAILSGRLQPGLKLPSTRALSLGLGIARNTAIAAYDLLLGEGYIIARHGAGNYVADIARGRSLAPATANAAMHGRLALLWRHSMAMPGGITPAVVHYDFGLGVPDSSRFPFEAWQRLSARALRALSRRPASFDSAQGRPTLRAAIASHVSFARAVACTADDVVVTAGAQQAFDLLARILVTPGRTVVAVEDPGYPPLRHAFDVAGAKVVPVPVDSEGLVVERLPEQAAVVCVTPSHQFPLGVVLSPRRRAALLAFARMHHAVIIEDDYDSEFRYGPRPLDALRTLDRDATVCYVGTFSKSLVPTLRKGYVVAPPWAREALVSACRVSGLHGDVLTQDTLAAFIAEGLLSRHVRRMRRVYAERRERLLQALAMYGEGIFEPLVAADAGLHLSVRLRNGLRADAVVARAAEAGIAVDYVGRYAIESGDDDLLAFGFGAIEANRIDEAVSTMARQARRAMKVDP